jgi:hypothetical protein
MLLKVPVDRRPGTPLLLLLGSEQPCSYAVGFKPRTNTATQLLMGISTDEAHKVLIKAPRPVKILYKENILWSRATPESCQSPSRPRPIAVWCDLRDFEGSFTCCGGGGSPGSTDIIMKDILAAVPQKTFLSPVTPPHVGSTIRSMQGLTFWKQSPRIHQILSIPKLSPKARTIHVHCHTREWFCYSCYMESHPCTPRIDIGADWRYLLGSAYCRCS